MENITSERKDTSIAGYIRKTDMSLKEQMFKEQEFIERLKRGNVMIKKEEFRVKPEKRNSIVLHSSIASIGS
jgi:hypothetical protein